MGSAIASPVVREPDVSDDKALELLKLPVGMDAWSSYFIFLNTATAIFLLYSASSFSATDSII